MRESGINIINVFCEGTPAHLMKYNADKRGLEIFVLGPKSISNSEDLGEYTAQNSFGASAVIKKSYEQNWRLEMPYVKADVFVPMAADQARSDLPNLRFGVVGDLNEPYVSDSRYTTTPTIREPREVASLTYKLHYNPKFYVLFDTEKKSAKWIGQVNSCKRYEWSTDTELKIGKC